jgi:hypothetical protein
VSTTSSVEVETCDFECDIEDLAFTGSKGILDVFINSPTRKCTTFSRVSVEAVLMALAVDEISTCISEPSIPSFFSSGGPGVTSLFRET